MKITLYISFVICFTCALAQNPVVQLKVLNLQPKVGELITIEMTSNMGSDFNIKLPAAFKNRGKANGINQENINGNSNTVYYQVLSGYFITSGEYVLGPVYVKGRSKTISSNKVKVSVSTDKNERKSKINTNSLEPLNPPIFAETACSSVEIYRGQSVSLKSKVYSKKEFTGIRHYEAYSIEGKHEVYEAQIPKDLDWQRVALDGQQYLMLQFEEKVIFPNELGAILISPFEMILTGNGSYKLRSESNTIKVLDLPKQGQPTNFSGLVGSFKVKAALSDSIASANDIVSLTIEIDGIGNLQHAVAPEIELPNQLELYSDPITTNNYKISDSGFKGNVIFTYPVRVLDEKRIEIAPISISFFEPKKGTYTTVKASKLLLNSSVLQNSIIEKSTVEPSNLVKPKQVSSKSILKVESNLIYRVLLVLSFGAALLFLFLLFRRKRAKKVIPEIAYKVPNLSMIQKQIDSVIDPLIPEAEALSKMEDCLFTLCSFLLSQDSLRLSRNEIYLFLSNQISQEQINDIRSLFTSIDAKRYAVDLSEYTFLEFKESFKERVLNILKAAH